MGAKVLVLGAGFGGFEPATILSDGSATPSDHADRQERRLRLRLFEARCDVRPRDARRGAAAIQAIREARRAPAPRDGHRDRPGRPAGHDRPGHPRGGFPRGRLGADYDFAATPGLGGGTEFYTVAGAERLRESCRVHRGPGSSASAARRSNARRRRAKRRCCCTITSPPAASATPARSRSCSRSNPVPPSPETSRALLAAFAERNIAFVGDREVRSIDTGRRVAMLDDGREFPYDLFLGVPSTAPPKVVEASGMAEDGYVPVDPRRWRLAFPASTPSGIAPTGHAESGRFRRGCRARRRHRRSRGRPGRR